MLVYDCCVAVSGDNSYVFIKKKSILRIEYIVLYYSERIHKARYIDLPVYTSVNVRHDSGLLVRQVFS